MKFSTGRDIEIDNKRLSRDFQCFPLKFGEKPLKQDLEYLYLELNLNLKEMGEYLNHTNIPKLLSFYKIKKSKILKYLNQKRTYLEKYGVDNPRKYPEVKKKIQESFNKKYRNLSSSYYNLDKIKRKITNIKNLGVEFPMQNEEVREKSKLTNQRKYGGNSSLCSKEIQEKSKSTKLEKYGDENFTNREKFKNTCLEKYGVDNPFSSFEVRKRIENTCLEKYGVKNITMDLHWRNTTRKTFQDKYNCLSPFGNSLIHEKSKQTWLKTLGVENPSLSEVIKKKKEATNRKNHGGLLEVQTEQGKLKRYSKLKRTLEKSYQTKKLNNSFNKSKIEDEIYNLLKSTYPDVVSQYRDFRYPFSCDFYIPSLDVFIEYNGTWTHGPHLFNENNPEDLKILEEWKKKSEEINFKDKKKNYYKVAIYTWTDLDVRKRETAKANGLNYYVFYNEKEFMEWYNKQ